MFCNFLNKPTNTRSLGGYWRNKPSISRPIRTQFISMCEKPAAGLLHFWNIIIFFGFCRIYVFFSLHSQHFFSGFVSGFNSLGHLLCISVVGKNTIWKTGSSPSHHRQTQIYATHRSNLCNPPVTWKVHFPAPASLMTLQVYSPQPSRFRLRMVYSVSSRWASKGPAFSSLLDSSHSKRSTREGWALSTRHVITTGRPRPWRISM